MNVREFVMNVRDVTYFSFLTVFFPFCQSVCPSIDFSVHSTTLKIARISFHFFFLSSFLPSFLYFFLPLSFLLSIFTRVLHDFISQLLVHLFLISSLHNFFFLCSACFMFWETRSTKESVAMTNKKIKNRFILMY